MMTTSNHIVLAALTFVLTNIDDLLILSVYFASPKFRAKNIVLGQYLGILLLIGVSLLSILIGEVLDRRWISLLGLLPILLAIKDLIALRRSGENPSPEDFKSNFQFLNVALVTIVNGGDNIGVYSPLFATVQTEFIVIYIIVFLLLTAVWCLLGYYFVSHRVIKNIFSKYGRIILPFFLILLGLFIVKDFFI